MDDLVGSFFGMGGGGPRRQQRARTPQMGPERGTDVRQRLELELLDAIKGILAPVDLRCPTTCPTCEGQGGTGPSRCGVCMGGGRTRIPSMGGAAFPCSSCGGSGRIFRNECKTCAGTTRVTTEERIKVKVPPGVTDGQVIRLKGKGGSGLRGGPAGDLMLEVDVQPHTFLRRNGNRLEMDVPITAFEAMAGGRIEVPTLKGPVRVKVPAGATNGTRLRLRGRGPGKADLFIVLRPVLPTTDDADAVELARKLAEFHSDDPRAHLSLGSDEPATATEEER